MIILGNRASAAHMTRVLTHHLMHGIDNEDITILQGGKDHIAACIASAKKKKVTFAIRHFVISPHVAISVSQAFWVRDALAAEFGFRADHVTLVQHSKPRLSEQAPAPHFHLLAAEYDPINSTKVLSSAWSYPRHEKIARLAELHFGHRLVPGPHQDAVVRRLDADGEVAAADALRPLEPSRASGEPASGWDAPTAAPIARAKLGPAETIRAIRDSFVMASSAEEFRQSLADIGLMVRPGEKRETTPCVYAGSNNIGALHRILGRHVAEIRSFLAPPALAAAGVPDGMAGMPSAPVPYLTETQIEGVFDRLVLQAPIDDVDRSEVVRLQGLLNRSTKLSAGQRGEMAASVEERAGIVDELSRMGWFGRRLFLRRHAKVLADRIVDVDARIADLERFLRTVAEPHKTILSALRKARQIVESRDEAATLKRKREVERLAELKLMVLDRGMKFVDAGEVEEFAAERHDEDGVVIRRPDVFGHVPRSDPDVGRMPGGF